MVAAVSRDGDNIAAGCFLFAVLVWLAAVGTIIYVAAHFIAKVW